MPSVFQTGQVVNGSFRAGLLSVTIGGSPLATHVAQQLNAAFNQQVTMLFEIGSNFVYLVGGRAQGQMTIGRVIGPTVFADEFIRVYNDLCKPGKMSLSAETKQPGTHCKSSNLRRTLTGVVLTGLQIGTQAQDVVMNESLSFMFTDMETG